MSCSEFSVEHLRSHGWCMFFCKRDVSLPFMSLKIHPGVETSKYWVFVFFTGYAALCPGTMYSKTRLRSRRPRRGESSADTFQSWDVMHMMIVCVSNAVCGVSPLHMSSSCVIVQTDGSSATLSPALVDTRSQHR